MFQFHYLKCLLAFDLNYYKHQKKWIERIRQKKEVWYREVEAMPRPALTVSNDGVCAYLEGLVIIYNIKFVLQQLLSA